ncbi:hypothetical protein C8R46DRAFT_1226671 [Mycena filopes]|nr:hypothetical protein C8R46DRAFT_1226671 [Mycena filopes]
MCNEATPTATYTTGELGRDTRTPALPPQLQLLPPAYMHDAWYEAPTVRRAHQLPRGRRQRRRSCRAVGTARTTIVRIRSVPHSAGFPASPAAGQPATLTPHRSSPRRCTHALRPARLIPMPPRYLGRMMFGGEGTPTPEGCGFDPHAAPYAQFHDHAGREPPHPVLRSASAASFQLLSLPEEGPGQGQGGDGVRKDACGFVRRRRRVDGSA